MPSIRPAPTAALAATALALAVAAIAPPFDARAHYLDALRLDPRHKAVAGVRP